MPTTRARHTLTETEEVAAALAVAAQHWPDDKDRPARLLLRLVKAGEQALTDSDAKQAGDRRRAIRETRGIIDAPDMSDAVESLREDWPA